MKCLFGSILAIAMAACLDPASQSPASASTAPAGDDPRIETLVTTTWQEQSAEICFDWFLRFCSPTFPSPQCPAAPAGQPCSPAGAVCYQTLNRQVFRYYQCE
jgi:hypothetical protein